MYVLEYARLAAPPEIRVTGRRQVARSVAPIAASQPSDPLDVHAVDLHAAKDRAEVAVVDLVSLGPVAWWLQVEAECTAVTRDLDAMRNPSAADSPARRPNRP